jgi:predicted regulator of Ras-like GTPase activity (Roadblock/LC7/MglB family)
MTSGLVVPADLVGEIQGVLAHLQGKTQVGCILLADMGGQLIATQSTKEDVDPVILSALTASNMAATTEIARQIGEEKAFKLLLHEGERQNCYISGVGDSLLLVVIFDQKVQLGLVRLFAKQAVQQLIPLAERFETLQAQPQPPVDNDFGAVMADELEDVFGDWE